MITLLAALSAGAKPYLRCNFSIFFFNDLTERLGGWLYKCGCIVKLSILMSMMRKIHLPVVKGMHFDAFLFGPTFTVCLKCILDNIPAFSKINPGWKSIFRPFLKE